MSLYSGILGQLLEELERLPGIGPKTAQRLAFHILRQNNLRVKRLADILVQAKDTLKYCNDCFSLSEQDICQICEDTRRDKSLICVVEEPHDVFTLERTKIFNGLYHVLLGKLSPFEGVGPEDIKIAQLLNRLKTNNIKEVIIATNPDVEGEATAIYLNKIIQPLEIKVTRLASGLPAGGNLEYADDITLSRALQGRREIQ